MNTLNEKCGREINTILFFYSNEEEDIENSERLGRLIGLLYERNKERIVIYSIDLNLDSEVIDSLKEKYNLTSESVVILNEKEKFYNLENIDELESRLK